ncbi:MAG: oligosaccharide flippase family protein [Firmicutes bacterium]|nr:oligosaccharide flippase family protein [Bacillota bacterium]MCM1401144.1 oligosaccharide flippase family protein [Bacteroides sp.]MCM1477033.1 oligosaccharide flippase family protein [Bacteroides sp.]
MGKVSVEHNSLTRRVLSAMGLFGSVEVLTMLCAVVRTKLVAVFIGVSGVGLLGLFTTAVELLSTLVQMGIRTTAVRSIASSSGSEREVTVASVIKLGKILACTGILLTIAASPLLSKLTFGSTEHAWAFVTLSLAVGCNTMVSSQSAVLQGEKKLSAIAKASVVSAIISLAISVPLIVYLQINGVIPILLSYSIVTYVVYTLVSQRKRTLPTVQISQVKERAQVMIKLGAFLTASSGATWLANYLMMSYFNKVGGDELMGLYQTGYTLSVKYVGVVFTAMSLEYFPRLTSALSSGVKRGQTMLRHETFVAVSVIAIVGIAMILLAPWIVNILYSSSFSDVVPMVVLASPGLVLRAVSWAMAFTILALGKGKMFFITESCSCLTSLIAMIAGYELGGLAGIGIGFTAWYAVYTLIVWWCARQYLSITLGLKLWSYTVVIFTAMCLVSTARVNFL